MTPTVPMVGHRDEIAICGELAKALNFVGTKGAFCGPRLPKNTLSQVRPEMRSRSKHLFDRGPIGCSLKRSASARMTG